LPARKIGPGLGEHAVWRGHARPVPVAGRAGSGSRGSLADLKIVPGHAVMLAAGAVSAEAVS
jgi:hypothetical protein